MLLVGRGLESNDTSNITIESQKAILRQAHDKVKMMRDTAAAHH